MRSRLIAGCLIAAALWGCHYDDVKPAAEVAKSGSVDYLVFGHTASFCLNCDAIYKIENGELYGASHQMITDPETAQLELLPDSSFQIAKSLTSEIPSQLLAGSSSSIHTVGTYFPDVGHFYFEVSSNHEVHRWYVEEGNTPDYLLNFLNDVREAMSKLR